MWLGYKKGMKRLTRYKEYNQECDRSAKVWKLWYNHDHGIKSMSKSIEIQKMF